MNSTLISNFFRFVFLLVCQVIIFNEINIDGYLDVYPYILFIILYPVNGNKNWLLITSFLLGLTIDYFLNSSGVHATACLVLAFVRPWIFKFSFGLSYEYQTVKLNDKLTPERFSFILISVALHNLILFLLETLSFSFFLKLLINCLITTIFTVILCILIIYLFKPKRK